MGSWFTTAEMPAIYTFSQSITPFFYLFVRNPGQRWLVVQSQERRESDLGKLSQRITKAESKAVQDLKKLSPGKFACEADAIKGYLNYSNNSNITKSTRVKLLKLNLRKKIVQARYPMKYQLPSPRMKVKLIQNS
jgi:hypothetical protein